MAIKKKAVSTAAAKDEVVEITFDFSKLELFELLDLVEVSAQGQVEKDSGQEVKPNPVNTVKTIQALKKSFVSSSRKLTGYDFENLMTSFWKEFALVQSNPN